VGTHFGGCLLISARATDNNGNITTSTAFTIHDWFECSSNSCTHQPRCGAEFQPGSRCPRWALANDSDGTVASVQFFANGLSIGSASAAPYAFELETHECCGAFALARRSRLTMSATPLPASCGERFRHRCRRACRPLDHQPGHRLQLWRRHEHPAQRGHDGRKRPDIAGAVLRQRRISCDRLRRALQHDLDTHERRHLQPHCRRHRPDAGVSGTSTTVSVTISPNGAPTVALVSPGTDWWSAFRTAAMNLSATASDSDGTIANVRFLANGTVLATSPTIPMARPLRLLLLVFTPSSRRRPTILGTLPIPSPKRLQSSAAMCPLVTFGQPRE